MSQSKIDAAAEQIVTQLIESIQGKEERVVECIAWGWCCSREFNQKKTPWNLMLVVNKVDRELMKRLGAKLHELRKGSGMLQVFVFGATEALRALDSYPIEFAEAKYAGYSFVDKGQREQWRIPREMLRVAVERELRGLVLHARHAYIRSVVKPKLFANFVAPGGLKLLAIARAMLLLLGKELPEKPEDTFEKLGQLLEVDLDTWKQVYRVPVDGRSALVYLIARPNEFIDSLERATEVVDKLSYTGDSAL